MKALGKTLAVILAALLIIVLVFWIGNAYASTIVITKDPTQINAPNYNELMEQTKIQQMKKIKKEQKATKKVKNYITKNKKTYKGFYSKKKVGNLEKKLNTDLDLGDIKKVKGKASKEFKKAKSSKKKYLVEQRRIKAEKARKAREAKTRKARETKTKKNNISSKSTVSKINTGPTNQRSAGVINYNGHRYTYYSSNVLYHYRTSEWTPDNLGYYRDSSGYLIVACDFVPMGGTIATPWGTGKVYDCGAGSNTVDMYVSW